MIHALLSWLATGVYKYPEVAVNGYESRKVKDPEKRACMYEMLDDFVDKGFLEGPCLSPIIAK